MADILNQVSSTLVDSYGSFAQLLASFGANKAHLIVNSQVDITENVESPINITIEPVGPGLFNISTGCTLTINGPFVCAPEKQAFALTGTGAVRFGYSRDVYPEWFGIDGLLDYLQVQNACDSILVNGGTVILSGQYNWGTDVAQFVQIPSNVTIKGLPGNELSWIDREGAFFFKAASVSNIRITGTNTVHGVLVNFYECDNIEVDKNYSDGTRIVPEVNRNMLPLACWIGSCRGASIHNNTFLNFTTSTYFRTGQTFGAMDPLENPCTKCSFKDNLIEHTITEIYPYPCGVQIIYNVKDIIITGNIIKNIACDSATSDRMAYGVYQGDGVCDGFICNNNTIINETAYDRCTGILGYNVLRGSISGNTIYFDETLSGANTRAIRLLGEISNISVVGNSINGAFIYLGATGATDYTGSLNISSNTINNSPYYGIYINGGDGHAAGWSDRVVRIDGNVIKNTGYAGIYIRFVSSCDVNNNTIIDANTVDGTDDDQTSGIVFSSVQHQCAIGNRVENRTLGHVHYGIRFSKTYNRYAMYKNNIAVSPEIKKYIGGYGDIPTGHLWEIGDTVENVAPDITNYVGWTLLDKNTTTNSSDVSSGRTIAFTSVADVAVGDMIGIVEDDGTESWGVVSSIAGSNVSFDAGYAEIDSLATAGNTIYILKWSNQGDIQTSYQIQITSTIPRIIFRDTDDDLEWDIRANGGYFAVYDRINSVYPIRIYSGAPTDSVKIFADGHVSLSDDTEATSATAAALVVAGGGGYGKDVWTNQKFVSPNAVNAGADVDKFVVIDATGNHDFRTGAEVLSDIGGQGSLRTTRRVTATPDTVTAADQQIFVDTDSLAITVNLPAGINGTVYKIVNCGSSGRTVTVVPNGANLLFGSNTSEILYDGEIIEISYETTEGWW
jgi:parallel beta-helix repeat protein